MAAIFGFFFPLNENISLKNLQFFIYFLFFLLLDPMPIYDQKIGFLSWLERKKGPLSFTKIWNLPQKWGHRSYWPPAKHKTMKYWNFFFLHFQSLCLHVIIETKKNHIWWNLSATLWWYQKLKGKKKKPKMAAKKKFFKKFIKNSIFGFFKFLFF